MEGRGGGGFPVQGSQGEGRRAGRGGEGEEVLHWSQAIGRDKLYCLETLGRRLELQNQETIKNSRQT